MGNKLPVAKWTKSLSSHVNIVTTFVIWSTCEMLWAIKKWNVWCDTYRHTRIHRTDIFFESLKPSSLLIYSIVKYVNTSHYNNTSIENVFFRFSKKKITYIFHRNIPLTHVTIIWIMIWTGLSPQRRQHVNRTNTTKDSMPFQMAIDGILICIRPQQSHCIPLRIVECSNKSNQQLK